MDKPNITNSIIQSNILIQVIDDDKIIRSMLSKSLQNSGYRVISSDNGVTGIEQYKNEKPNLILLDVLMPGMNGYEICRELRKIQFDQALPILMLTGLDDVESINIAFSAGATDFVTKPVNLALLVQRVKYALKGRDMFHELQHRTNELSAILTSASDSIVTTDLNNSILDANPAFKKLFLHNSENLNSLFISQFIENIKASGTDIQSIGKTIEGESFPIEYSVSLISIGDKEFKSYFIRDLTERYRIEHMKGEFIQTVSHELRTPIAAIKGAVSILNSGVLGDQQQEIQELINIPLVACHKLENLVDDILDVSILEDPMESLIYDSITIHDLFEKVMNEVKELSTSRNIQIEGEDLQNIYLNTDKSRMQKAVRHLLSNAIKFSPVGKKVTMKAFRNDRLITIQVIDNGPGIPEADRVKIFEKFIQLDNSSTRQQGGTGLGLYIAKLAVEKLNGKLDVESTMGVGSTFTISIPFENYSNTKLTNFN